jgi:pentatricopeptide repeat protein
VQAQCGGHGDIELAQQLFDEMGTSGITRNVHTYSAFISVLIKSERVDRAQEVFEQMQADGVAANLVGGGWPTRWSPAAADAPRSPRTPRCVGQHGAACVRDVLLEAGAL